jgi:hypothetical protein
METVAEVNTQEELDAYFGEPARILLGSFYDSRIDWDTHYVMNADGNIMGMSDGVFKPDDEKKP